MKCPETDNSWRLWRTWSTLKGSVAFGKSLKDSVKFRKSLKDSVKFGKSLKDSVRFGKSLKGSVTFWKYLEDLLCYVTLGKSWKEIADLVLLPEFNSQPERGTVAVKIPFRHLESWKKTAMEYFSNLCICVFLGIVWIWRVLETQQGWALNEFWELEKNKHILTFALVLFTIHYGKGG